MSKDTGLTILFGIMMLISFSKLNSLFNPPEYINGTRTVDGGGFIMFIGEESTPRLTSSSMNATYGCDVSKEVYEQTLLDLKRGLRTEHNCNWKFIGGGLK